MKTKSLMIKSLQRYPAVNLEDELIFKQGVNVIVGEPNTGKTAWIKMLDYLMGDESKPEDALGDLSEKYDSISAVFSIENDDFTVERRWKEKGSKTKVFINDNPILLSEFSSFLLEKLNIPILHFPQGNPYSERSWPEISWRVMLRHVYRQERFWSDIADKQPESEQHACLMQFMGIAEFIFPQQLGNIVQKRKELFKLTARKEQFQEILSEFSKEVIADETIAVAPTDESINTRITSLNMNIEELLQKRNQILNKIVTAKVDEHTPPIDMKLGDERLTLLAEIEETKDILIAAQGRLAELEYHYNNVQHEIERLERTKSASQLLANLKVTHCPVCDQEIDNTLIIENNKCYLCNRFYVSTDNNFEDRIDFESEQLKQEKDEVGSLIQDIKNEMEQLKIKIYRYENQVSRIESLLQPFRVASASYIPPDLSVIDANRGSLEEKVQQLERLKKVLLLRGKISDDINNLDHEITRLQIELDNLSEDINYEEANNTLGDNMNSYLNALNSGDPKRWPEDPIYVKLKERGFDIKVGNSNWSSKLGATLKCYLLMAYHYGLLSLSGKDKYHYPGLSIIDLPPSLADGSVIIDKENYIVEPFIALLNSLSSCQLIVAGRSFDKLVGAHKIELNTVWV